MEWFKQRGQLNYTVFQKKLRHNHFYVHLSTARLQIRVYLILIHWLSTAIRTKSYLLCSMFLIMIGVNGWMFLLVPAHPGCPGQNPESHKTVVVVVVVPDHRYLIKDYKQCWLVCSNLPPVEKITINLYREADKRRKKDAHLFVGKHCLPLFCIEKFSYHW